MENETYFTYDLGCASALVTAGANLIDLDRTNYRKIGFIFESRLELREMVDCYWKNQLKVDARTYFDNTKMLKTRIYSEK